MTDTADMSRIFTFAGLGSKSLFSEQVLALTMEDSNTLEARVLLEACHGVFKTVFASANPKDTFLDIDLEEFMTPESLIQPPTHYRKNSIIQHVYLYLAQLLRYMRFSKDSHSKVLGLAGFCAGLLPSAVIATTRTTTELLSRGQDFFYVALYLGIRSEGYKQAMIRNEACSPTLPWSVIVDGLSAQQAQELLQEHTRQAPESYIYVSAINSSSCVTLSGRGDHLDRFSRQGLPSRCKVRATNVYCLYHDRRHLSVVREEVLGDLRHNESLFSSPLQLVSPLFSGIDGKPMNSGQLVTFGDFCGTVLEMILLEPVDWVAMEDNILTSVRNSVEATESPHEIVNFGPGYGMSRTKHTLPDRVKVIDATTKQKIASHTGPELPSSDTIAIVGMGLELPGASDASTLWRNLKEALNSCTEIPGSRFHVEDFYQKETGRALKTKYGNFMENPFLFDNELFKISPREASSIDPQQRVMLQTAYRALEDAGYVPDSTPSFSRKTFGCFIGNATIDYTDNLRDEIDVYYSPGTLRAFQSGRISYAFKWSGPSITLDTACSSSITAIHQASRALLSGDCRAALVGGVNVITSPDMYLGLDRAHFLSPTGQCKTFDESADGYCRSEGCVAFVLKKLDDAMAEGDQILGIIRGVEINQSGNARSITHSHAPTQEDLFGRILKKSKIHPHQITVAETHGTGTQTGDVNELIGIRKALCTGRDPSNLLHLTSIKANIGHSEAASGGAALAKLLLMMKHREIPPQISLNTLNHKIQALGTDGAVISRDGAVWPRPLSHPRLALLNNFGAAGSNGALILQEYGDNKHDDEHEILDQDQSYMLGFSARSDSALLQCRDTLISHLQNPINSVSLRDMIYSSTARRQIFDYRIAVDGSNTEELVDKLKTVQFHNIRESADTEPHAVFAFSGQGSQYLGMGRELMRAYPEFKKTILRCEQWLLRNGYPGFIDIMMSVEEHTSPSPALQSFQTAMFVLEACLARLLISIGIIPTLVVGHSLGEYAALVIAGVLDLQSGLSLVAHRAKLISELCQLEATSMLAVQLSADVTRDEVDSHPGLHDLSIACDNGPSDCVVGGPLDQIRCLKEKLGKNGTKSKLLDVPIAYHTKAMDPILDRLTDFAKTIELSSPKLPVLSNVFGRLILPGEEGFTSDYFAAHARQTVALRLGIQDLHSHGMTAEISKWVEIGPHPTLLPMVSTNLDRNTTVFLTSLRKGTSDTVSFARLLSHFYLNSTGLNWRKAFDKRAAMTTIPVMPFMQQEFGVHYPHEHIKDGAAVLTQKRGSQTSYGFLSRIVQPLSETNSQAIFETPIAIFAEYILGHSVCGYALCPASVYHEIALSAAKHLKLHDLQRDQVWSLSNVTFVAPLIYSEGSSAIVGTSIEPTNQPRTTFSFKIFSRTAESGSQRQTIHCQGQVKIRSLTGQKNAKFLAITKRKKSYFFQPDRSETQEIFLKKAIYEKIFTRVVTYSGMYQMVQSIRIDQNEALAVCRYPKTTGKDMSRFTTILMDVLLHVAGFVANLSVENREVCICKEVRTMILLRDTLPSEEKFEIHCSNLELESESLIIADAYATDTQGLIAVFKGMSFQRMKLDRMTQAMHLAHRKSGDLVESNVDKGLEQPVSSPLTVRYPKTPEESHLSVRDILAKTCNLDAAKMATDVTLQAMGFDSLLMIELSSTLSAHKLCSLEAFDLTEEATVGDIEQLCADAGESSLPSSEAETPSSVAFLETTTPMTPVTPQVASIIAATCGAQVDFVTSDVELQALGIDSLMMMELKTRLQSLWTRSNLEDLSDLKTVGDVEKLAIVANLKEDRSRIERIAHQAPGTRDIVELSTSTGKNEPLSAELLKKIPATLKLQNPLGTIYLADKSVKLAPLFLIHDGSGICLSYHRIQPFGRTIYAVHDPKFLEPDSWSGIPAMAQAYAKLIKATDSGPLILGGWSFGGVVAFEAARVLHAEGHAVAGVVLIDSPPPFNHKPLSTAIINDVVRGGRKGELVGDTIRSLVRKSFTSCARMLEYFKPEAATSTSRPAPRTFLLRSKDSYDLNTESDGGEFENPWLQDRSDPKTSIVGWETVTGAKVPHTDIPGNHFQAFDAANIQAISKVIAQACHELENDYRRGRARV